jgi:acetyl-CoA carboxylase biotin carboxyl carrier protein
MAAIDVKAETAGIVWTITASVGTEVAEDDKVVILESMKMEIPIVAPKAGKVAALLVAEGDIVEDGTIVARLEI